MQFLNKIKFYSDLPLFFDIILCSSKAHIFFKKGNSSELLKLASCSIRKTSFRNKDKIVRYINFYLSIKNRLGIKDTCLTHSVVMCHVLRKNSIDAKINFGARKKEDDESDKMPLEGHCWVDGQDKEVENSFEKIFSCP